MIVEDNSSASNDPWPATSNDENSSAPCPKSDRFEDSFVEQTPTEKPFEKLPDSEEYLAGLERKLKKLTNPKNQEKSLLKALSERRSDEARRYLDREAIDISVEFSAFGDGEVSDNVVLRKLFPDKQPIHLGELEKLIDADVLDINCQDDQELKQVEKETGKIEKEETENGEEEK